MMSVEYARYINRLENYKKRHNSNAQRYAISSKKEIEEQLHETSQLYKRWLESKQSGSKSRTGYSKNRKIIAKVSAKKINTKLINEKNLKTDFINKDIDDFKEPSIVDSCLQYDDELWNLSRNQEFTNEILEQLDESETNLSQHADTAMKQFDCSGENQIFNMSTCSSPSRQHSRIQQYENPDKNLNLSGSLPTYETVEQNKAKMNMLPVNSFLHQRTANSMNIQYKTQHQTNSNQYIGDILYNTETNQERKIYNDNNHMWSHNPNLSLHLDPHYHLSEGAMMKNMNMFGRVTRTDGTMWTPSQFNHLANYPQQNIQKPNSNDIQSQMLNLHNYPNQNNYYLNNTKSLDPTQYNVHQTQNMQVLHSSSTNLGNIHMQNKGQILHNSQLCNWDLMH